MRHHFLLACGFAIAAALGCSSKGTDTLSGAPSGSTGSNDNSDGGCPSMGTAVSDGQGYVVAEGCEGCHGSNMAGQTTALTSGAEPGLYIKPGDSLYPPNLTPDTATGIGSWTDGQINEAITEGVDNQGRDLCPEMGRHYPNMCPDEVTGIIAYLRSIPAVSKTVPGSICPPLKTGS